MSLLATLVVIQIIDIHYRHGYQVHLFWPPFIQGDMEALKVP